MPPFMNALPRKRMPVPTKPFTSWENVRIRSICWVSTTPTMSTACVTVASPLWATLALRPLLRDADMPRDMERCGAPRCGPPTRGVRSLALAVVSPSRPSAGLYPEPFNWRLPCSAWSSGMSSSSSSSISSKSSPACVRVSTCVSVTGERDERSDRRRR
jgi:hypothetical protein